jgi:ubiquinone/menaquinone biosynthesis C-methylase UbiE
LIERTGGHGLDDAKLKAKTTYNAAAEFFDDRALGFWERFGQATVDRLTLAPGGRVLDVCAGAGASAIPAAVQVGPTGRVVAVDLAENLLALAQDKGRHLGLCNLEIRLGDLEALDYRPESFDAVVIVFGIFFLPDMTASVSGLWRLVKPGGQLAVTTWGPRLFEPANSLFWDAVAAVRPDLARAYNPWDGLTDPGAVRSLLLDAGATGVDVEPVSGTHPLRSSEDFWTIVLGSGFRATYDAMSTEEQHAVHTRTINGLGQQAVTDIETNVIYATASKAHANRP